MAWVYNTPEGTPTNGPTLTAGALAMTGLALVTVLLRLYVRTTLVKAPGWGMFGVLPTKSPAASCKEGDVDD
jgi:hypothetical protein